jgi:opacity protein-like surface antigen
MTVKRILVTAMALACLGAGTAAAQSAWGGNFALGYSWPLGTLSDKVSGNIAFAAGLRYAPEQWPVGLRFEFQWNEFDPKSEILDQFRVGGANASIWSITANLEWNRRVARRWGYYLIGGVGYYERELQLTDPGAGFVTVCDPWWGICYPVLVPVETVVGSYSDGAWGLNGGGGVYFPMSRASEFYIEARYHWIDNDNGSTQFIPLMFGFRF